MSCRSFFRQLREKSATERKQFAASSISEPAKVADAWKTLGQNML